MKNDVFEAKKRVERRIKIRDEKEQELKECDEALLSSLLNFYFILTENNK